MPVLNSQQIKEILPHRYPFLLVDVIDELVPGERVVGRKNLTINEAFFQGHFPQKPVMPGVLIIEALAQCGGVALLQEESLRGKLAFLTTVKNAKFRRQVEPGDVLRLEVEITKLRPHLGLGTATGKAYVGDELAAEADMSFVIGEASND